VTGFEGQPTNGAGLDVLRAALDGRVPAPPPVAAFGLRLVEVDHGIAVFELDPAAQHLNGQGMVHGGVLGTLIDSAAGCAVLSTLGPGLGAATQDLRVSFLRPVTPSTGRVRAVGRVLSASRRSALAEARVEDPSDLLVAFGTATCAIIPLEATASEEAR
jgi:uncharacterized protein (TIGR00369 family)